MAAASSIFAFLDDDDLAAMKVACSSSDIGSMMFWADVSTTLFWFIIAEM